MAIKPAAHDAYFDSRPEERALANKLDEGFDVTYGRPWGELAMWLSEPKTHMRERFGFVRELLVIYSKHPRTDARVLTAIDNISRTSEYRHRIERAIALLVHCGKPEDASQLLQEHPDWIVVPITANELNNPERGDLFLRSRIANTIGTLDVFGMSSPITSDQYFLDEMIWYNN